MKPHHTTTSTPRVSHRPATGAALVLALAAMASWAQADILDIAWNAGGRFERNVSVAPGKFAEFCGKLPAGLKVGWTFEASAPMDFNVHYHVGKAVVFPSKLAAVAAATDTLVTKIDQDYCWMWSNKTAASATIKVVLQR